MLIDQTWKVASFQREKVDFGFDQTRGSVTAQKEKAVVEIAQKEMSVFVQMLVDQKLTVKCH